MLYYVPETNHQRLFRSLRAYAQWLANNDDCECLAWDGREFRQLTESELNELGVYYREFVCYD